MFISIKTISPHEGNSRAERIGNPCTQFFHMSCLKALLAHMHHNKETCDTFFRNHEPNCVPEMELKGCVHYIFASLFCI